MTGIDDVPLEELAHSLSEQGKADDVMEEVQVNKSFSITKPPVTKKYSFRNFQEKAAELFKISSASIDTNHATYSCLSSLLNICRQNVKSDMIKDAFASVIQRNSDTLSSSTNNGTLQLKDQPLPSRCPTQGRPTVLRKRSKAEVYRTNKPVNRKKEKSLCGFCKGNTGHKFFQCGHLKVFGTPVRVKGEMFSMWMDNLNDPQNLSIPAGPLPPDTLSVSKPLLHSIPKETIWLVIEKKCAYKAKLFFVVTLLGEGGIVFNDKYKFCCIGASTMISWIRKSTKNSNHIINALPDLSVAIASQLSQSESPVTTPSKLQTQTESNI